MKKIIVCIVSLVFITISFGQRPGNEIKTPPAKKFYLQAGTAITTADGASFDFGLQTVLKSNWTAGISFKHVEMKAKNLPSDYERGFALLIFFPVYDEWPLNKMNIINLTLGRCIETGRKTWFTAEGGLSFVSGEELTFTSQPVENNILYISSNYSYRKENKTGFGIVLKSDFNWAIFPFAGLGAGAFANLNSVQSPLGFELKLIFGNLRKPKKK